MIEIPILGAVSLGVGTVLERSILKNKKISVKFYQTISFFVIILVMLPFLYFFWKITPEALQLNNILLFAGIIASAITANLLIFYSEKWEKITNTEPARILEPMFTILLALLLSFFTIGIYDRNFHVIIPALIASIALIFPHIKKHHLSFNKYFIAAILGSFFFALELVLSKPLLSFYSSVSFYFIRCAIIFLISLIAFRPSLKPLKDKKITLKILIVGAIWVAYRIAIYIGYMQYGVTLTTLILMTGPIFIYILANRFLKEKLNWKNIVSSLIIIACVLYALLF
jgi:drug/metabolite transporter (DMT)-like permease